MTLAKRNSRPRAAASDFIALIHGSGHQAWIVLAVESTLKKSAATYARVCKTEKHFADVPIRAMRDDDKEIAPFIASVQIKDSPWLIIMEHLAVPFGLREIRAAMETTQKISAALKTRALAFFGEDTSFSMGFQLFKNGKLVGHKEWESQTESSEKTFTRLGLYLPACWPCGKDKKGWLAAAKPSLEHIERADLFTSQALDLLALKGKPLTPEASRVAQRLIRATRRGELKTVCALLKSGAVLTSEALYAAAKRGRIEILKLLLEGRRPKDIPFSPTLIAGAVLRDPRHTDRQIQVMELLINAGAEVEGEDDGGFTAMLAAARNNSPKAVELLIRSGADVNWAHRSLKETPLHWAAEHGHLECVKVLVEAGAKVDAKNYRDRTPLGFARANNRKDVVKFLRQAEKGDAT